MLVVGLATALAVTLSSGPAAAKSVLLQSAASPGPDPYTTSPTKGPPPAAASASPSASPTATTANGAKVVSGSSEGLYGGTENQASCDVNQLSTFLTTHPDKGKAWAGVEGIAQSDIPAYLHSLTPVVLRTDTRVTNHGFSNGQATTFQSVLQAGTAVLVDSHGVPRVRCSCGNPLLPPAVRSSESFTGAQWPTFRPQNVVVVQPAPVQVTVIVLFDPETGQFFSRPPGTTGHGDQKVPPPTGSTSTSTTTSTTTTTTTTSPSGSGSPTGTTTPSSGTSSTSSGSSPATQTSPTGTPTGGQTSPPAPGKTGTS